MAYADLTGRLRHLAMAAHEAYYLDRWDDVEVAARGLEQSARFLNKALAVPPEQSADLGHRSEVLAKDAAELRAAAQARPPDAGRINAVLQRIHNLVRDLRPRS
jgi:hypothetical protein